MLTFNYMSLEMEVCERDGKNHLDEMTRILVVAYVQHQK